MPVKELETQYREGYGQHAPIYDSHRFIGTRAREQFAAREGELIVDLIQPQSGMNILDVGCGTGRASLALASADSGATIVGADMTMSMLHEAARKRDASNLHAPVLACANARALPFKRDTFDAVVSIRVLHLFPPVYWGAFVEEMTRVLRPGGTLLIEFDSPLAGGAWGLIREALWRRQGNSPRYYLWPHHLDPLFAGLVNREVVGFWLPGVSRLGRWGEHLQTVLTDRKLPSGCNYLGNRLLVRAQKPLSDDAPTS